MGLDDHDIIATALAAADRIQRLYFILEAGLKLGERTRAILNEALAQQVDHLNELDARIQPEPTAHELRAAERGRA